ncbi:hypothetical protein QQF64_012891 [Cirrhinus molitorella]|uniref:Uncharacterized protein n=1 Tax=Cirrhinus molitorella TaxID=172907 RepID=A0ABR3LR90_9TELE
MSASVCSRGSFCATKPLEEMQTPKLQIRSALMPHSLGLGGMTPGMMKTRRSHVKIRSEARPKTDPDEAELVFVTFLLGNISING